MMCQKICSCRGFLKSVLGSANDLVDGSLRGQTEHSFAGAIVTCFELPAFPVGSTKLVSLAPISLVRANVGCIQKARNSDLYASNFSSRAPAVIRCVLKSATCWLSCTKICLNSLATSELCVNKKISPGAKGENVGGAVD